MNLEILNRDRALSLVTGVGLCSENKRIDEFFEELFNGMTMETIEGYADCIFFVKKNNGEVKVYMGHDYKNGYLWCVYDLVWTFLEDEIGLKYSDVQTLIKERVEEAFIKEIGTPKYLDASFYLFRWKRLS